MGGFTLVFFVIWSAGVEVFGRWCGGVDETKVGGWCQYIRSRYPAGNRLIGLAPCRLDYLLLGCFGKRSCATIAIAFYQTGTVYRGIRVVRMGERELVEEARSSEDVELRQLTLNVEQLLLSKGVSLDAIDNPPPIMVPEPNSNRIIRNFHPSTSSSPGLRKSRPIEARQDMLEEDRLEPIAIIGLSLEFPQEATNPESFWKMLTDKRCAMTDWPKDRVNLDAFYHGDGNRCDTVKFSLRLVSAWVTGVSLVIDPWWPFSEGTRGTL